MSTIRIRRWGPVIVAALALSSPHATAQRPAEDLERLRTRMLAAETSPASAAQLLAQVLAGRAELLAQAPDDPDAIFWRTAQAEDLLFAIERNALGLRVRYALASPEEQSQYDRLVRQMLEQTAIIRDLLPGAEAGAEAGSLRAARLEVLRNLDLPRLDAVATEYAIDRGLVDESRLDEVIGTLEDLRDRSRRDDRLLVVRSLGPALARAGRLDEARACLETALAEEMDAPLQQIGLRSALFDLRARESGPIDGAGESQIAAATSTNPVERLMFVEQAARLWMAASRQAVPDRDPLDVRREYEAAAAEAFLLLDPESGGLSIPGQPRALEFIVEERLGRLGVVDPLASHLPATVAIAEAVPLAVSAETAARARDLLVPLMDRPGLIPRHRARLVSVLVHADVMVGDRPSAVDRAITWSQLAADRPEAHDAAELAATIAWDLWQRASDREDLRDLRDRATDNLLIHFDDHAKVESWRLRVADVRRREQGPEAARIVLEQIAPGSAARMDALAQLGRLAVDALRSVAEEDRVAATERCAVELASMKRELDALMEIHPARGTESRAIIELCLAQIDLLQSRPYKALERLSRPEMNRTSPAIRQAVDMARVEAALANSRPAAVRAVVASLAPASREAVARQILPRLLAGVGDRLPSDPLESPVAAEALRQLAELLEATAPSDVQSRLLIAESFRRGGVPDRGLTVVETILAEQADLADAIFVQAECLRAIPETEESRIIPLYGQLIKGTDPTTNHGRYWTAQVRLLESMRDHGRDPEEILARINRLRQQWPELGGTPWRGRIIVVEGQLRRD